VARPGRRRHRLFRVSGPLPRRPEGPAPFHSARWTLLGDAPLGLRQRTRGGAGQLHDTTPSPVDGHPTVFGPAATSPSAPILHRDTSRDRPRGDHAGHLPETTACLLAGNALAGPPCLHPGRCSSTLRVRRAGGDPLGRRGNPDPRSRTCATSASSPAMPRSLMLGLPRRRSGPSRTCGDRRGDRRCRTVLAGTSLVAAIKAREIALPRPYPSPAIIEACTAPPSPPLVDRVTTTQRANERGGHIIVFAARILPPCSLAEAAGRVARSPPVRAAGTGHSFNDMADSPGAAGHPGRLSPRSGDSARPGARVGAFLTYASSPPSWTAALRAAHLALAFRTSSVAGACAPAPTAPAPPTQNLPPPSTGLELSLGRCPRGTSSS